MVRRGPVREPVVGTRLLVGMCSGGDIKALTVLSLIDALNTLKVPNAISIQLGGYKPHGLNQLVKDARQIQATHLLNVDCDMIFPPESFEKMLQADKDIVGVNARLRGNHVTQDQPESSVRFAGKDGAYKSVNEEDFPKQLFECAAVGLGLMLIDMRVFDKLPPPYFRTFENENEHRTEDIVFCQDAKQAGFKVWCEPGLKIGHIGSYIYQ